MITAIFLVVLIYAVLLTWFMAAVRRAPYLDPPRVAGPRQPEVFFPGRDGTISETVEGSRGDLESSD